MAQWGTVDRANNSVNWAGRGIQAGSGAAAIAANNTALYNNSTPNAFVKNIEIGQFAVTKAEIANTSGESAKTHGPGWALRRAGQGGIATITVVGGTGFSNGETVVLSGGQTNAIATLTTNATGNLVSASVTAGLFPNTSVMVKTYQRQKHLLSITPAGTGTGYANTDYIVAANGISVGSGNVVTNATGGLGAGQGSITVGQVGLWANNIANTLVTLTILAANGAASNGSGATLTANLVTSTANGTLTVTLGGRANRVTYETLTVVKGITAGNTSTLLPS